MTSWLSGQKSFRELLAKPALTLGIDASNLRGGGGVTHLRELLGNANPRAHGFSHVVVWGSKSTLSVLNSSDWLIARNPQLLEGSYAKRLLWQAFCLPRLASNEKCDIVFAPGGTHFHGFRPVVTMSRNMLPFELEELRRYGLSLISLRLLFLRYMQLFSFKTADGVIFLNQHASLRVQQVTGALRGYTKIIPHGVGARFFHDPKAQRPISSYSINHPYRLLYVSIIDQYKHQWCLVEALGVLRKKTGWPLVLDLVGPAYPPALRRLEAALALWDPHEEWVVCHGAISYSQLHELYQRVDLGLFASSCENMPNILLETMAAGLPIAASNRPPMSTILGDAGLYFNPLNPTSIASTLECLIGDQGLRARLSTKSYSTAHSYSWPICASQTFSFLADVCTQWSERVH